MVLVTFRALRAHLLAYVTRATSRQRQEETRKTRHETFSTVSYSFLDAAASVHRSDDAVSSTHDTLSLAFNSLVLLLTMLMPAGCPSKVTSQFSPPPHVRLKLSTTSHRQHYSNNKTSSDRTWIKEPGIIPLLTLPDAPSVPPRHH